MRIFTIVGFLALTAKVQGLFSNTLAADDDRLDLAYDSKLACGGCLRAGYTFCMNKDDHAKGRGVNDFCCRSDDLNCLVAQISKKGTQCATGNSNFFYQYKDDSVYFKDPLVAAQKFCMKRQDKAVCCGKTRKDPDDKISLRGDDCKFDFKSKFKWQNITLSLNELPYGGSCTYEVNAKCGYPKLVVNNSNIDMIVAFKKKHWDNDTYEPSDDD